MFPKLNDFNDIVAKVGPSIWWKLCKFKPELLSKCRNIVKLCIGEHEINRSKYRYNAINYSNSCLICSSYENESIEHMLFRCETLQDSRQIALSNLLNSMPQPMVNDFNRMDIRQKCNSY